MKKIGEFFEENGGEELAVDYYRESAELFGLTKFHVSDIQKLKVKIGDILSNKFDRPEKLREAIQVYEEIGYEYLSNNLMRF